MSELHLGAICRWNMDALGNRIWKMLPQEFKKSYIRIRRKTKTGKVQIETYPKKEVCKHFFYEYEFTSLTALEIARLRILYEKE